MTLFIASALEHLEQDSSWLARATYTPSHFAADDLGAQDALAIDPMTPKRPGRSPQPPRRLGRGRGHDAADG
jgi:hypothetical protein